MLETRRSDGRTEQRVIGLADYRRRRREREAEERTRAHLAAMWRLMGGDDAA